MDGKFVVLLTALILLVLLTGHTDGGWWGRSRRRCSSVNCAWNGWGRWGSCSSSCNGKQARARSIRHHASCGGSGCHGPSTETRRCGGSTVHCSWYGWGGWSSCSSTCNGIETRRRSSRSAKCGGRSCSGSSRETSHCGGKTVHCSWYGWGGWSSCSSSCNGIETRTRSSRSAQCGGRSCSSSHSGTRHCGGVTVHCSWSTWESWGACSSKCNGTQERFRSVSVQPSCSGNACSGPNDETRVCGEPAVNCSWSSWNEWGNCSSECGHDGEKTRTRSTAITSSCGGEECLGEFNETTACNRFCKNGGLLEAGGCNCSDTPYYGECCEEECVIGEWGTWGECSATFLTLFGVKIKNREVVSVAQCREAGMDVKTCRYKCGAHGMLDRDGVCECNYGYIGEECEKEVKPNEDTQDSEE